VRNQNPQGVTRTVIQEASQATPEWLTAALCRSGALNSGAVQDVLWEDTRQSAWSKHARLNVQYTRDAQGELPARLFLKMVSTREFGPSEVQYYTRDYVGLTDAPLLRCYDACYGEQDSIRSYHLLLEDVSRTHTNTYDKDPSAEYGSAIARSLAILHARHWGVQRLRSSGAVRPGGEQIRRYVEYTRRGLAAMIGSAGGDLAPQWPALLERLYKESPTALAGRLSRDQNMTLIHGDLNPGNIFVPEGRDGPVRLIDRQPFDWSLTVWVGVSDVVGAIVRPWDTAVRRRLEERILRDYHAELESRGVTNYLWEDVLEDYRLCLVQPIFDAIEYCAHGEEETEKTRWLWLPHLKRAIAAYLDHNAEV
jgi:hypothetical protein